MATIGDRIRSRREQLGISQTSLADAAGISKQTLYKYEYNIVTNIPSDKIETLSEALQVHPAYLMGWESEKGFTTDCKEGEVEFTFDGTSKELVDIIQSASGSMLANLLEYARFLQIQHSAKPNKLVVHTKDKE